jgi:D-aspartate ligase
VTWSAGAVVVGGDYLGLGIVRSLGRRGVPICTVDDERSIARFSRFATYGLRVADLRDEGQAVQTVLDVGGRLGLEGWVLYPTREENGGGLLPSPRPARAALPGPDARLEHRAVGVGQAEHLRLAQELAIPTPRTWYPQGREDLERIDADPPFAVKPVIKEHFFYTTKAKAWRANTRSELAERFERAAALTGQGEVMVQELIPGDGHQQFAYCAFFKDGAGVGRMVARRRRQHPPEFGPASTFVETVDLPVLETYSERFLRAIGYYGLVEMEYKLDRRDGRYKLLDVNARAWGYHTLGQRAGVDFPFLQFADQLGEQVRACRASAGVRWIRLVTDVPTAAYEFAHRQLDRRGYLRSLADVHVEAVFSRDDPLPGLAEVALIPYLSFKRGSSHGFVPARRHRPGAGDDAASVEVAAGGPRAPPLPSPPSGCCAASSWSCWTVSWRSAAWWPRSWCGG